MLEAKATTETMTDTAGQGRAEDLFEVIPTSAGLVHDAIASVQRRLGDKREVFRRSELVLANIDIAGMVRSRFLKPLQDDGPEIPGLTMPEVLAVYLPDHARPIEMLEAALALSDNPFQALPEKIRRAIEQADLLDGSRWNDLLVERLLSILTPACLLPILKGLDHRTAGQGNDSSNVSRLCGKILASADPQQFKGDAAVTALPRLLEMLEDDQNGNIAPLLLQLITVIAPAKSFRLYSVLRKWERQTENAVAQEAAEHAVYALFLQDAA